MPLLRKPGRANADTEDPRSLLVVAAGLSICIGRLGAHRRIAPVHLLRPLGVNAPGLEGLSFPVTTHGALPPDQARKALRNASLQTYARKPSTSPSRARLMSVAVRIRKHPVADFMSGPHPRARTCPYRTEIERASPMRVASGSEAHVGGGLALRLPAGSARGNPRSPCGRFRSSFRRPQTPPD